MFEEDIREHALTCYPEECVGFISPKGYHRLTNVSKSPRSSYSLSVKDRMMLFSLKEDLVALVHSHPIMDSSPSEKDIEAHRSTKFDFLIIGTDGTKTTSIRRLAHE